jgi:succinoglycan biosynthesis transport protein ExoP
MTPDILLRILKAGRITLMASVLACAMIAVAMSWIATPQYRATALVFSDVKSPDPVQGALLSNQAANGYVPMSDYMATQIDIMGSPRVARAVVDALKLVKYPAWISAWEKNKKDGETFEEFATTQVKNRISIEPPKSGNVITIRASDRSPEAAKEYANAFADAYIKTVLDLRVQPAREYAKWFSERVEKLRMQLDMKQSKMIEFKRESGLSNLNEQLDIENTKLQQLAIQLAGAQARSIEARSKTSGSIDSGATTDANNSPVVQSLRLEVARRSAILQELSKRYGQSHPAVISAKEDLESYEEKLNSELMRVTQTLKASSRIGGETENSLKISVEFQRAKLAEMANAREKLKNLTQEVESAQRAYDLAFQRQQQSLLESENQLTNVSVLSPAALPLSPYKPNWFINTIFGVVAGVFIGLGLVALKEIKSSRIWGEAQLQDAIGAPVLISISVNNRSLQKIKLAGKAQVKAGLENTRFIKG